MTPDPLCRPGVLFTSLWSARLDDLRTFCIAEGEGVEALAAQIAEVVAAGQRDRP